MLRWVGTAILFFPALTLAGVTYRDVAPVLQSKCQRCHHPNDIAPFALMTYDDAQTWAADIRTAVSAGVMPPWKPVPGYGEFRDAYGLTADERQLILDWVDQGAQPGDPVDTSDTTTPPPPDSEWRLGQPD